MEAGGRITAGSIKCRDIKIGGVLEVAGALEASEVLVGGLYKGGKAVLSAETKRGHEVETQGGFKAEVIKIGSRARCTGPLVGGVVEFGKGCKVQDVYGRQVVAHKEVRMARLVTAALQRE